MRWRQDSAARAIPAWHRVFAEAVDQHRAGRLTDAMRLYSQVLAFDPRHADSLHLLGLIAAEMNRRDLAEDMIGGAIAINGTIAAYHASLGNVLREQGRSNDAIDCYRTALACDPGSLEALNNLGNTLNEQGRLDEAADCYRHALVLKPALAEVHYNLGNILAVQGRREEAIGCYRRAIGLKADYAEAHYNLGNVLGQAGRLDEAIACYRQAVARKPEDVAAHNNLGNTLKEAGRAGEAIACYRQALAIKPDYAEAHNNLGNALREYGLLDEAVAACRQAVVLRPAFAETHYNLGIALSDLDRFDEAVACFRRALALRPYYPQAHNNLGIALRGQGQLADAASCLQTAMTLKQDFPEAHNNLGIILREQGNLPAAISQFRRALVLSPHSAEAHKNLGMALLASGDMETGWAEFEWRWKTPKMREANRGFTQPQWRGEAAAGRTLLVHAEQGFGDTLQFCRYAALAAARGWRVILEVQAPLARLLRCLPGVDRVVTRGAALPAFDLHCPMLSLPLALGITFETNPAGDPYLVADEALAAIWRTRLAAMAGERRRIGLVWAGNATLTVDARRSIAPALLAPLLTLPGLHAFSLQKDGPAMSAGLPLTDLMDDVQDFADTAALITNLDLVISVDTAVVHLAAALGKPVWLLDRFDPCWRWRLGRRDSPWYPTLRLYRQPRPGDWGSVMTEVIRDLRDLPGRMLKAPQMP